MARRYSATVAGVGQNSPVAANYPAMAGSGVPVLERWRVSGVHRHARSVVTMTREGLTEEVER